MDYKGIYYGDSKSQRFFEFGAHFKYSELYKQLELLGGKIIENNDKFHLRNKSIDIPKQILLSEEKKMLTRNINNNNNLYLNNPNSQNFVFNKIFNSNKNRKKNNLFNSTNTLNSNYGSYYKMKKSILLNIPTSKEKKKNNILEQNNLMSRNKFKNLFIHQTKIEHEIPSLKTQVPNLRNNSSNLKYNSVNSPQNNIKYNLIHIQSRNKNNIINSNTDGKRKGLFSSIKRKTYENETLINKSKNKRKFTITSQNFNNLKLNIKNPSSRNSHKKYITKKLNSNRFNSEENILNKNFKK
jgi:hypothetical protein